MTRQNARIARTALAIALLLTLVALCGCAARVVVQRGISAGKELVSPPTATPTATPTPSPTPTRTPRPTATPLPKDATPIPLRKDSVLPIPAAEDVPFELLITEEEINDYVAGKTFEEQGFAVSEIVVTLTEQEAQIELIAAYDEMNLSIGGIVHGVPHVVDGLAYAEITGVELDPWMNAITRRLATGMIEQAIEDYSTEYGIQVPIDDVLFETIELQDGAISIAGRTT